jgi:hypothetical protein
MVINSSSVTVGTVPLTFSEKKKKKKKKMNLQD